MIATKGESCWCPGLGEQVRARPSAWRRASRREAVAIVELSRIAACRPAIRWRRLSLQPHRAPRQLDIKAVIADAFTRLGRLSYRRGDRRRIARRRLPDARTACARRPPWFFRAGTHDLRDPEAPVVAPATLDALDRLMAAVRSIGATRCASRAVETRRQRARAVPRHLSRYAPGQQGRRSRLTAGPYVTDTIPIADAAQLRRRAVVLKATGHC
jgi:hypothetical protein